MNLRLVVFWFCLSFTVAGGLLILTRFEPEFHTDTLFLTSAVIGGVLITFESTKALLHKDFGVDVLASIAIWISIVIGEYLAAAVIVIMLNGGELLEEYVASRSSKAIEKLIASAPTKARVRRNGVEIEINLNDVEVGEIIFVNPSEKIPIDGVVIKGNGFVNQATITGESIPSEKSSGSIVYGNTLLENGALDVRVTKEVEKTVFAQIVRQVEEAQLRRAPIERLADRYARWFAPIILLVALGTQLVSGNVPSTAAVLVISCPCALTLATPIAVAAGLGSSARKGILIRGGTYLEEIGKCDIVVIDKTGTVTIGKPKVINVKPIASQNVSKVLFLASTAEQRSEHSFAKAIIEEAKNQQIHPGNLDNFHIESGFGVVAENDKHKILVGNLKLMDRYGIVVNKEARDYMSAEADLGRTTVVVAEDLKVIGIISIADTIRDAVRDSITQLKRAGAKKVIMLTGDNLLVARDVANQAGIDEVYADLLPEDKVKYVEQYRRKGYRVIFIGDGINDAPAMASANVGIAMGVVGTDIAIETAGIVLMNDDLNSVAKTINISKRVLSIVKQNVLFALCINVLGLFLSTQGFINPVLASIIHEGNALIVALNSVRILMN